MEAEYCHKEAADQKRAIRHFYEEEGMNNECVRVKGEGFLFILSGKG
jgi:hypothetical protein